MPRRDLKSLLFIPHAISRVASQLLFRELSLHFGDLKYNTTDGEQIWRDNESSAGTDDAARHAQRSADILTRIILDPSFAHPVRTLRIFASTRDGGLAFQTGARIMWFLVILRLRIIVGMLTNALPKLINLRHVHISSGAEGLPPVLRILQSTNPNLRGLSLQCVVFLFLLTSSLMDILSEGRPTTQLICPSWTSVPFHIWHTRALQYPRPRPAQPRHSHLFKISSHLTVPLFVQSTSSLRRGHSQAIHYPFET